MLAKLKSLREEHEDGFTLIELLVVILIIGILASIAIPVFLNQRQTANDASVKSDVRNASVVVETGIIGSSNATTLSSSQATPGSDLYICIGASTCSAATTGAMTAKTSAGVAVSVTGSPNSYTIRGWHTNGKKYTSSTTAAVYSSASGGLTN